MSLTCSRCGISERSLFYLGDRTEVILFYAHSGDNSSREPGAVAQVIHPGSSIPHRLYAVYPTIRKRSNHTPCKVDWREQWRFGFSAGVGMHDPETYLRFSPVADCLFETCSRRTLYGRLTLLILPGSQQTDGPCHPSSRIAIQLAFQRLTPATTTYESMTMRRHYRLPLHALTRAERHHSNAKIMPIQRITRNHTSRLHALDQRPIQTSSPSTYAVHHREPWLLTAIIRRLN